jgi:hypothetical protein
LLFHFVFITKKKDITMFLNGEKFGWIACRVAASSNIANNRLVKVALRSGFYQS